jgi:PAS domain S-box-containing protein
MFYIHNLRSKLALPDPPSEEVTNRLRDRIAELEEENANLKQLDETIRKNIRLFDRILLRSQEGILLLTPDMIILRLIRSSVGYAAVDLSGQPVLQFIHPEDADCFKRSFSDLLSAQSKTVRCEVRLKLGDGSWAWVEAEMTDLLDDPDVQAILLNGRNITKHKHQTEARERLESYRACQEYAMFSKSLDGIILDWNPGAEEVFGYSAPEIVGQNAAQLVPRDLLNEEISTCERIAKGEEVSSFQTIRIHKDGQNVEIDLKLAPVWDSLRAVKAIAHLSHAIRCANCRYSRIGR